ncbi:MAG: hypothetical protein J6K55_12290 [Clostridia bacterium]|nr:hypothetical protein [Clostridia bacterium]
MGNLQMQMVFRREVSAPLLVQSPVTLLKQGDSDANVLIVDLYDKGEAADASGHTVSGYLLRADGNRVPLEGSVAGNRVTVQMNEHCYLVPGPYGAFVRLVKGDFKRTILEIAGEVESEGNGPVVDVDEKFITIEEVIEQIEAARQATEAAADAAQKADNSAGNANSAAETANTAAQTANSAAARAKTAAASVEGMTVSSEDVGPGTQASAQISSADGKKHIHFKLRQGATGATPDITFRVATGEPGTQVEIQQSGTPEHPIVDLTIPRGDTGAVDGIDYYAGNPAALGTASPGTANGLARGDHVHPMPSAADVGALPSSGTAADSEKLGGKAPEYYIQPRNLLDNSDFSNPVNQRGQTSYTVEGYTIDRWFSYDGISLTVSPFGFSGRELNQLLEGTMKGIHTLAAMKTDGTLLIKTGEISAAYSWSNSELAMGTHNGNTRISLPTGSYKWAALYEGTYTAETLPPYMPKGYEAEFYNCTQGYPIGSIYMSVNSTSPAFLFGGTWEKLKDRFLLGTGDKYWAGNTGGEAEHILTIDEMPNHNHTFYRAAMYYGEETEEKNALGETSSTTTSIQDSTGYTGSGWGHNNMPPYLVVYMWKRVS